MIIKHFNLKVSGKVQGVWYRGSAQQKAQELGLKGWVKNMPDGNVYAEAEGTQEQLQAFVEWCRRGPELASVENVEMHEAALQGFERFEVLR